MPSKIKVLIIDHSDINRQDVFHQLENQNYAVSEADCEDEALKHKPALFDVIVTEINLPYRFRNVIKDGTGIKIAAEVRKTNPSVAILFHSFDEQYVGQAEDLYRSGDGGIGYLSKECSLKIASVLPAVLSGNWVCVLTKPSGLNPDMESLNLRGLADTPREIVLGIVEHLRELKEDEKSILRKIGESNHSIAQSLNLAVNTIETKLTIIYSKLGLEKIDRRLRPILLDRALSIFYARETDRVNPNKIQGK